MSDSTVDYFSNLEEAWLLSEAARDYVKAAGRPVDTDELWNTVFSPSPLVDIGKTQREGGRPLQQIFLKTPYALQYRPNENDWIPFRYAHIHPDILRLL